MAPFSIFGLLAVAGAFLLGGCQSAGAPEAAVLEAADSQTMAEVKSVLARALNRASVEIGPGDPTKTPTISALPPRLAPSEDRSLAAPTYFDLAIKDGACVLIRRDTGEEFALTGVRCKPAQAE